MLPYTIDTNARTRIYFLLAIASVSLAGGIANLTTYLPLKLAAPSAMLIFCWLIAGFDKYAWRWWCFHWLTGIPLLEGEWRGTLTRAGAEGEEPQRREVTLTITQTWRSMSLVLRGMHSKSHAQVIALHVADQNDIQLKWIYLARDNSGTNPHNLYGEGTTELAVQSKGKVMILIGIYYSSKLRKGSLKLTKSATKS